MTQATRRRRTLPAVALLGTALVPGLTGLPAFAEGPPAPAAVSSASVPSAAAPDPDDVRTWGDTPAGPAGIDLRGTVGPLASQRAAASRLDADVRWNSFGTPASISPRAGALATATSGKPVAAARAWLRGHADVLGLTAAQVDDLALVNNQKLAQSPARAVLFRQSFGGLTPALGSMVTVGVAGGRIHYVSSSLTRTTGSPAEATASPLEGWLTAAEDVGLGVPADDIDGIAVREADGWTRLDVPGLAQEQLVRPRALALADGSVKPVLEANVVDAAGGAASAFTVLVDATDGETVLYRENRVEHSSDAFEFQGSITATECGPKHPFELTDDATRSITAVSVGAPTDDHVVRIFRPSGELLTSGDLGTNPEAATYSGDALPAGSYAARVCPYDDQPAGVVAGPYTLSVTTADETAPSGGGAGAANPRWRFFTANPALDFDAGTVPRNDVVGCWFPGGAQCTLGTGPLRNIAAVGPWDTYGTGGIPSNTTTGNNASTHEAWISPLTPGGLFQAPVSPTREYTTEFTDTWNNERCNPSALVPGGNDIDLSVGNLFVAHNRMHDYSYYLGFDESNYNLQTDNFGRGGLGGDAEVGNAQAGALSGGQPSFLGRDNANQIALQDGVPGITNQYLFQPIAGAFYAPCTDGGLDMGIVGHEYTHAISNRMVAGPDQGLTSEQGGAMGESWGDLVAAEYQFSHGYDNGGNVWAVGAYATGNKDVAIRDYAINHNPLNYSDYGFDTTGDEVHADGEIWNGTNWEVRRALVEKYDARFPYDNRQLQLRCARGTATSSPLAADKCPGNRRWIQLVFDAFLLQQGDTSMLDARDAMLAADRMRFGGADQKVIWDAFARRGMGRDASTPSADSGDTVAGFASPRSRNARVTFRTRNHSRIYVGQYEARATPVADTVDSTPRDNTVGLVPGTHRILLVTPNHGAQRFRVRVSPGERRTVKRFPGRNLADVGGGALLIGASEGSLNPESLLDGTEGTSWAGVNDGADVGEEHPFVAVDLAGGRRTIRRVQVSALLRPTESESSDVPLAQDPDSGSRFTALRKFALERCVSGCGSDSASWRRFFTSGDAAFPGRRPRPVAPNQTLRSFRLPRAVDAEAVRLVALENQCTGFAGYAGEQDDDPANDTDCKTASDRGQSVRAAELQVFSR